MQAFGDDGVDFSVAEVEGNNHDRDLAPRSIYGSFLFWLNTSSISKKILFYSLFSQRDLVTDEEWRKLLRRELPHNNFTFIRDLRITTNPWIEDTRVPTITSEGRKGIWLSGGSTLLASKVAANRAIKIEGFIAGAKFFSEFLWPITFSGLLSHDLLCYFLYPENRFGIKAWEILAGIANNQQTLSVSLNSNVWWFSILLGTPLFIGIVEAFLHRRNWAYFKHERDELKVENGFIKAREMMLRIEAAAKWLRYVSYDRPNRQKIRDLVDELLQIHWRAKGFLRLCCCASFAKIFSALEEEDLLRLENFGVDISDLRAMRRDMNLHLTLDLSDNSFFRNSSLSSYVSLNNDASYVLQSPQDEVQFSRFFKLIKNFYVNYLLWTLGRPNNRYVEPLFWLYNFAVSYAKARLYMSLLQFCYEEFKHFSAWYDCSYTSNKIFTYVPPTIDEYDCTICGDFPHMNPHDVYGGQTCLDGALKIERNASDVVKIITRVMPYDVNSLDLSHQNWRLWNATLLESALTEFAQGMNGKEVLRFDFSQNRFSFNYSNNTFALVLANFFANVVAKNMNLENSFPDDATASIALNGMSSNSNLRITIEIFNLRKNNLGTESAKSLALVLPCFVRTEILDLSQNNFDDSAVPYLCQTFQNASIGSVNLSYNKFSSFGINMLVLNLFGIVELDLSGNTFNAENFATLGMALTSSNVAKLIIADAGIDDAALVVFAPYLPNATNLQHLNLANNYFTSVGFTAITNVLPATNIYVLNVYGNRLGINGVYPLSLILNNTKICDLNIGATDCSDGCVEILGHNWSNAKITRIGLAANRISTAGVNAFFSGLNNTTLTTVDFSSNKFGDEGVCAITNALISVVHDIRVVRLSSVDATPISGKCLANALRLNPQIEEICFDENALGDAGFSVVYPVFPASGLKIFSCQNCGLTDLSMQNFTQVLPKSNLTFLNFANNLFGGSAALLLAQSLITEVPQASELGDFTISHDLSRAVNASTSATKIEFLNLQNCAIDTSGVRALCRVGYSANLSIQQMILTQNNIDPSLVDTENCWVSSSAASTLKPPFTEIYQNSANFLRFFLTTVLQQQIFNGNLPICGGAILLAFRYDLYNLIVANLDTKMRISFSNCFVGPEFSAFGVGAEMILRSSYAGVPTILHDLILSARIESQKSTVFDSVFASMCKLGFSYGAIFALNTLTGNPLLGYLALPVITNYSGIYSAVIDNYKKHGFFAALSAGLEEYAYSVPGGSLFKKNNRK